MGKSGNHEKSYQIIRHDKTRFADALITIYRDPTAADFFRRFSTLANDEDILKFEQNINCHLFWVLSVYPDNSKYIAGLLMLANYNNNAGTAEIGLWLDPDEQGKGLGFEIFGRFLQMLFFGNNHFQKITSSFLSSNKKIARVLEKGGFVKEGELKRNVLYQGRLCDETIYAMYKEEFQSRYGDRFANWKVKTIRDQVGGVEVEEIEDIENLETKVELH